MHYAHISMTNSGNGATRIDRIQRVRGPCEHASEPRQSRENWYERIPMERLDSFESDSIHVIRLSR